MRFGMSVTVAVAERFLLSAYQRPGMDYEEQLDRAIESSPDIEGSESRFSLPEPNVRQEGNVTVYENFQSTLDTLDREDTHVMKYLQNELGTSANIDERGRLRLTGEFRTSRVREAMEEYADAYVLCSECGLPDTRLETENGAKVLRCEACGARSPAGN
jgi:translation initiation factor 2 subunit 2